jgi:hypothetical protein
MLAVMTLAAIGDVIPIIAIMAGLWTVKKESYRLRLVSRDLLG